MSTIEKPDFDLSRQCHKTWSELREDSREENVRFCTDCGQSVHRVTDQAGLIRIVAQRRCVFKDIPRETLYLGVVVAKYDTAAELGWDEMDSPPPEGGGRERTG